MINNNSNIREYQANYRQIHGSMNPYTVLRRHPSQHYIFEEDLAPLKEQDHQESSVSVENIMPEVLHPNYIADDTKSFGNPYENHPNYATPSHYFNHLLEDQNTHQVDSQYNLLTSTDNLRISDPFSSSNSNQSANYLPRVFAPNNITLNKYALSAESIENVAQLPIQFEYKGSPSSLNSPSIGYSRSTETLNKKMMTSNSIYELQQIDVVFEDKQENLAQNLGDVKIREFSTQSLADLRELPNLSEYSGFNDFSGPSQDVQTCIGMSPSPYERAEFEYFENVAYGGI
ncbi:unnamed protein product [Caenorhabditis angaria]|uniref:Uncharacterized protein n=1 Tax=Caenorhabditis angaria TaxID=860376 RepID=A0A9P1IBP3_9PELO|nr:unnamed protein product [Caenorhabditis angaria]